MFWKTCCASLGGGGT
uniref:Uncharacterized protein n=1 Tax=Anguilla anguilla TaxID=7936 RepID=A0A0E9QNC4_ANGAN